MKVDNPRFRNRGGDLNCCDCPFTDKDNNLISGAIKTHLCSDWLDEHYGCPTAETYAEACKMAEKEAEK